jgi:hypothetical protein
MNLFLTRAALMLSFVLGWGASATYADPVNYENFVWFIPSQPERVAPLILERVRSFDAAFKNAYLLPLTDENTQIVARSTPLRDTDGVEYEIQLFVYVNDGEARLTFLNIACDLPDCEGGDLPDFEGDTLNARLLRAIVKAMDERYKRKPLEN